MLKSMTFTFATCIGNIELEIQCCLYINIHKSYELNKFSDSKIEILNHCLLMYNNSHKLKGRDHISIFVTWGARYFVDI